MDLSINNITNFLFGIFFLSCLNLKSKKTLLIKALFLASTGLNCWGLFSLIFN